MSGNVAVPADPFEIWIGERHRWLQTAAADLLNNKRLPTAEETIELSKLCYQEATGGTELLYREMPKGLYSQATARPAMRLKRLYDIEGVAAIRKGAHLDFLANDLAIVYGPNGSGKTGFSRILKQICGAKAKEDIHPNIFDHQEVKSSAKISFSIGDDIHNFEWSMDTGSCGALRQVQVFDSKTASMYAFSKSAPSFEPSRIKFISSLIKICDSVAAELGERSNSLPSKLPAIPPELADTLIGKWLDKLSKTTRHEVVREKCSYSREQQDERLRLETTLAEKNAGARLSSIAADKDTLTKLRAYLSELKIALSDENCKKITQARADAKEKRTAATVDADRLFAESHVEGVGTASWRQFWKQAKEYSTTVAYAGKAFPNLDNGAACLLCHREIDEDTRKRLTHFENFVKSGLEADAKAAENNLKLLIEALPELPAAEHWVLQFAAIKQPAIVSELYQQLTSRRQFFMTSDAADASPQVGEKAVDAAISELLEGLTTEENSLKAAQDDAKRKEMIATVSELKAYEWASQNTDAIIAEVDRRKLIAGINDAISLTKTTALTKKSNELSELEIETGYQDRFASELKKLGGKRLNVIPQIKKEGKGKVSFGISLKDAKVAAQTESILSEGEARIVALAAFLADITGHNQSTPFIFDDPISSLDQDFEERVVERLVELAGERQVIVFTHRLSLLALIEEAIKKDKKKADALNRKQTISMAIQTLRRMDKHTGILVPHRLRDQKPKNAITLFQNELIPEAQRLLAAFDPGYERYTSSMCSDFRILVESTVETNLLNEVVMRFRRSVTTQGRISALAKIGDPDCDFFDDLMTRYSVFEHSQSDELAAPLPELDQIVDDVQKLSAWIKEFEKRVA